MAVRRGAPRRSSYSEIIVHNTFPNTRVTQHPAIVSLSASDPANDVRPANMTATHAQMRHHSHASFDGKSYYEIWSMVESIGRKVGFFRRHHLRSRAHKPACGWSYLDAVYSVLTGRHVRIILVTGFVRN